MKKILLSIILTFSSIVFAQVGIGTTSPRAALEINSTTNGFLTPQVALSSTTISSPVTNPAGGAIIAGTIVYNTATVNDVTPGYYYWNGTVWVRMSAGAVSAADNTLDQSYDEGGPGAGRIINADAGSVTINNTNAATAGLLINNNSTTSGISGQRNNVVNNNTIGIVANVSADGVGFLLDHNDTNNPYSGIQVTNYSTVGSGILTTTNAAGTGLTVEAIATSNAANAMKVTNFRTGGGAAIDAIGAIGIRSTSQTASGSAYAGYLNATQGTAAQFNGSGTAALSALTPFAGLHRYGVIAQGSPVGIHSSFPTAGGAAFLGYASNYAGIWSAYAAVVSATYYDIYRSSQQVEENKMLFNVVGSGINATTIESNEKTIIMPAVSAPESLFQDYGTGKLINGRAKISINPILTENILVDEEHPLKVFIQLEGECNGVYVTNKSATGFEVIELAKGKSNIGFSYSIIASRAARNFTSKDGQVHKFNDAKRFITIQNNESEMKLIDENATKNQEMKKIEPKN